MNNPLRRVPWNEIGVPHLQSLIDDAVREGRLVEYKTDLYPRNDDGSREFLADVSSFANADGGDLIVGMEESDGVPIAIPGVDVAVDALIPALDSKIQDAIDPRILGIRIRPIQLDSGKYVVLLRIPQSWNRPHMVTFKNLSRFFSRNNGGKYQMDIREIREQVLGASAITDRIRQFRSARVDLISKGNGPVPSNGRPFIALHAIPFLSLNAGSSQSLPEANSIYNFLRPLGGMGWSHRINFDGLLTYSESADVIDAYLQIFRNGIVETVDFHMLRPPNADGRSLFAEYIDEKVEEAVANIGGLLNALAASPPIAWLLTLNDVKGYEITVANTVPFRQRPVIDRSELAVPEVIDVDMTREAAEIARQLMDPVWQAGGWPRSKTFEQKQRVDK